MAGHTNLARKMKSLSPLDALAYLVGATDARLVEHVAYYCGPVIAAEVGRRIDERAKDAARIEWLQCHASRIAVFDPENDAPVWGVVHGTDEESHETTGSTLREAIDAAMQTTPREARGG